MNRKSKHMTRREWREYYRHKQAYRKYANDLHDEHPNWF